MSWFSEIADRFHNGGKRSPGIGDTMAVPGNIPRYQSMPTSGPGSFNPSTNPTFSNGSAGGFSAPPTPGTDDSNLKKLLSFLGDHKDDILDYGQAAEGVYDKYRDVQDYSRKKPLRDESMRLFLDQSTPDTSAVFADPTAPTRYRNVSVGSRGVGR